MSRLLRILIVLAVLARLGVAGDFVGLDAASQVLYDIDSSTGRVLALRKLVLFQGGTLGAMDFGRADPYVHNPRIMINLSAGPSNVDVCLLREGTGVVEPFLDVHPGAGAGEAGLVLGIKTWVLSSTPTGATLEWFLLFGWNYGHTMNFFGSVAGQEAFGLASDAGPGVYLILRDASGSRLARALVPGPLDQDIIGPLSNVDDSLGISLQEHPTAGLLYLFSRADEALYTIDVTTAVTSLVAPLPGSMDLTSVVPRPRSAVEFCFGTSEIEPGCDGCPCSNDAPLFWGAGCLNSAQESGDLMWSGSVTPTSDTLRFEVTGLPPSSFAILLAGQSALPILGPCPLGTGIFSSSLDGIRCVGSGVVRLGTRAADALGEIGTNNVGWGQPDDPVGGLGAAAGITTGQTRYFQAFYRDDPASGCGTGLNTTQAVAVTGQ